MDELDHAFWHGLDGHGRRLSVGDDLARRYRPDVNVFAATRPGSGADGWASLAALLGPGGTALVSARPLDLPDDWERLQAVPGVQLVASSPVGQPDDEVRPLGDADVPAMLELTAATRPGPFLPRTHELGGYVGLHHDGRLVAMAGERSRWAGFGEISAVCTDAAHRGRGLSSRLVRHVAAGIEARGDVAFLHTSADNPARSVYERLGFVLRSSPQFVLVRAPG
ncbi:GNAT family N-acetyltransferase [Solicola sp. PLA-1-18]|uniref:GNAT family N-acetyltransferase n=1 Tax=Solicola sp. PLA-1-18 TaxID=3380532 RepID=UPI003B7D0CBE